MKTVVTDLTLNEEGLKAVSRFLKKVTEEEKQEIRLDWTRKSLNRVRTFENKFYELYPEFK